MNLFDSFVLDGVRRTNDGYLAAFARVARTGIQKYKGHELGRPDLGEVRLYRPPEEVFHADALRSFAHRPVTFKHPPVPVTAKNWKKYAGGQTGEDVVRDGEFVRVPMVMMDAALINAYEKDGVRELSFGYSTDIRWTAGITDAGESYDAVQTAIRGNHLAVVPVARGGDKLRIGDANDTMTCPECGAVVSADTDTCPNCGYDFSDDDNLEDGVKPMKLVIDGLSVNVADEQSGSIIEKHITTLSKKLKDQDEEFDQFKKKKKKDDEEVTDAKKMADALTGEVAVLKKQLEDAQVTPEKLDIMVKARAELIDRAKMLVDAKYVFDGKTIETIRKEAVLAKLGDAAKTMNDGAIEGAFIALTAATGKVGAVTQISDALRMRPHSAPMLTDARDQAHEEMVRRQENAWKTPA